MTQQERVLAMLQERPQTTASFLSARIPRFSARLEELKRAGYEVTRERLTASSYSYKLTGSPPSQAVDASVGLTHPPTQAPSSDPTSQTAGPLLCWVWDRGWKREPIPDWTLSETATATAGGEGRSEGDPITGNRRSPDSDQVAIPVPEPDTSESIGTLEAAA